MRGVTPGDSKLGPGFEGALAGARAGEEWAWQALYRSMAPKVRGYLRARERADADDLVGEVFMQVVRDLDRFEGGEYEFGGWVMTIAHHRLLDHKRRLVRRPFDFVSPVTLERHQGGDVESEALERIGDDQVRRALERLPASQRNVILLRVIGDMTVEQVAEAVGKSPGAVKQLQRRALQALRRDSRHLGFAQPQARPASQPAAPAADAQPAAAMTRTLHGA